MEYKSWTPREDAIADIRDLILSLIAGLGGQHLDSSQLPWRPGRTPGDDSTDSSDDVVDVDILSEDQLLAMFA